MPVVAVINRKGGSGKSTLATHIAAQAARNGAAVMLGDVDRQQSSLSWLRRRAAQPAAAGAHIAGWAVDPASVMRPPRRRDPCGAGHARWPARHGPGAGRDDGRRGAGAAVRLGL